MTRKFPYDRSRMKALVGFMLGRDVASADLGKALWLAEARNFALHGRPIAGAVYRRADTGPHARGTATLVAESGRSAATRSPLSAEERDSAEWALRHPHDPTCEAIWAKAEIGGEIPYHALLALRGRQPNADERAWAKLRAGELAAQ